MSLQETLNALTDEHERVSRETELWISRVKEQVAPLPEIEPHILIGSETVFHLMRAANALEIIATVMEHQAGMTHSGETRS